jgi:signal transduction histidine kinase
VKSDVIRDRGLRALYGVPLIDTSGRLVGVAHMGSTTATDFQDDDLVLFRALASRMTSLIASRLKTDQLLLDEHERERFLGVLGHDLRSPLASVVGSAQLMQSRGKLDESDLRAAARIVRAGERMARLVSDLLDFARSRAGQRMPLAPVWAELGDIVREASEEVEITHPGREVRVASTIRSRVCCDPDRITQAVTNVVGNAVKHGAPDAPVDVQVDEAGDDAVITVHNQGRPIPPKLLPHVFEPFRRGADDGIGGVGLGLFIANTIAVAHGGSIEVRSAENAGTTLVLRLPRRGPGLRE